MKHLIIVCLTLFLFSTLTAENSDFGSLRVTVLAQDSLSLQYANVSCWQGDQWLTGGQTKSKGEALISIPSGIYRLRVTLVGYNPVDSIFVSVDAGRETIVPPIVLDQEGIIMICDPPSHARGRVSIRIRDKNNLPLGKVDVECFRDGLKVPYPRIQYSPNAAVILTLLPGIYSIYISLPGYRSVWYEAVPVSVDMTTYLRLSMESEDESKSSKPLRIRYKPGEK